MVHKKKVADVRAWLQAQGQPVLPRGTSRLLLVSGGVSTWQERMVLLLLLARDVHRAQ